jgi:hypothetical protein
MKRIYLPSSLSVFLFLGCGSVTFNNYQVRCDRMNPACYDRYPITRTMSPVDFLVWYRGAIGYAGRAAQRVAVWRAEQAALQRAAQVAAQAAAARAAAERATHQAQPLFVHAEQLAQESMYLSWRKMVGEIWQSLPQMMRDNRLIAQNPQHVLRMNRGDVAAAYREVILQRGMLSSTIQYCKANPSKCAEVFVENMEEALVTCTDALLVLSAHVH